MVRFLMTSFQLTGRLLRQKALTLLIFTAVAMSLAMFLEDQFLLLAPQAGSSRIILQIAMGVWDFATGLLLLFILSWALPEVTPWNAKGLVPAPFKEPYLESFWAEYFRSLAQILLWGLLLIVPGFVRYARLVFVPFVALFSREYRSGQVDALKLSHALTQGRFGRLLFVLLATSLLELFFQISPKFSSALHTYPIRIAFYSVSVLISIWTYSFLFLVFESALKQRQS